MPTIATLVGIISAKLRIGSRSEFDGFKARINKKPGRTKINGIPAIKRMIEADEYNARIEIRIITGMRTKNILLSNLGLAIWLELS